MARQSPTWWSFWQRSAFSSTCWPPDHTQLEPDSTRPPTKNETISYGSERLGGIIKTELLKWNITDVANNMIGQVMSQPLPLLLGIKHSQTSPGHLKSNDSLRLRQFSHLAKLCCFLVGNGPVESEGVTTGTNLVEPTASAVYLVVGLGTGLCL